MSIVVGRHETLKNHFLKLETQILQVVQMSYL